MAEPEAEVQATPTEEAPAEDVAMGGAEEGGNGDLEGDTAIMLPDLDQDTKQRETFLDFLQSPIIELAIGAGESQVILSAHQALLSKSPYFAEEVLRFAPDAKKRRIELPNDDLQAVGSFLEYLYTGEYFPKRIDGTKDSALEHDPTLPSPDHTGAALLRHARVYTIADKFRMPALKSLAHSKIHRTSSTARAEIAYARYVYKETSKEDTTLRRPVAAFWATRSHVLRHEAEDEFRAMCLEYPQFGYDVLSLVLDQKEKRESMGGAREGSVQVHASGRKRQRNQL